MSQFLSTLAFSFSVTGPIFLVLALGVILKRYGMINDAFIDVGSRLVFNVTLPALLFISISRTHISETANFNLVGYGLGSTLVVYLVLEWLAQHLVSPATERGVVVQGAFRSNMGIIGLAYCINAYGDIALAAASLYLGLVTILFNVLGVTTLNRSLHQHRSITKTLKDIARNPLILGIVAALPVAWTGVQLPSIALKTGDYFAQMTLPLALLCTGGSLNLQVLRHESRNALLAASGKLIFVPLALTLGGSLMGFRDMDLGILFLMSSAPTAAASYIMVRAMGGNATLAANIVVVTTVGSLLATSIGITLLRLLSLM